MLDEILETFEALEDPEEQLRYLMDLGKQVPPMPPSEKTDDRIVRGCQSRVWMAGEVVDDRLVLRADSDAFIVRGLIAILLAIYGGTSLGTAASLDPEPIFAKMGLEGHLSMGRRNGLWSMVQRIRKLAVEGSG